MFVFSLVAWPARVYACDSLICFGDWFGITDIAKRDAERREKEKALDAQISAATQSAANDLARIQNARYESDNQRMIAIRQAEIAWAAYEKQWADWKDVQMKAYDAEIAGGKNMAEIAQAGIHESGQTQRSRIAWDSSYNIITVIIIGGIVSIFVVRRTSPQPPAVMMLPWAAPRPTSLQWSEEKQRYLNAVQWTDDNPFDQTIRIVQPKEIRTENYSITKGTRS
jgi:hypothetical protein